MVICTLGRGAFKDKGRWFPTFYIETPTNRGLHTGLLNKTADINDDTSVISGSRVNAEAAAKFFIHNQSKVSRVIWAAGRPNYLTRLTSSNILTEGLLMQKVFLSHLPKAVKPPMVILSQNKNTLDDVEQAIKLVKSREEIVFITVKVHLARLKLFVKSKLTNLKIQVQFLASEDILGEELYKDPYLKKHPDIYKSKAYLRTLKMEKRGIRAFKTGRYQTLQK